MTIRWKQRWARAMKLQNSLLNTSMANTGRAQKSIKRGAGKRRVDGQSFRLADEVRYITRRAAHHDGRIVTIGQLTLFSSETGDAWMIDRDDHLVSARPSGRPRTVPHRRNRQLFCDRLEGSLSHRRRSLRLHRSRYRPYHNRSRLPDQQARAGRVTRKFQICLASFITKAEMVIPNGGQAPGQANG